MGGVVALYKAEFDQRDEGRVEPVWVFVKHFPPDRFPRDFFSGKKSIGIALKKAQDGVFLFGHASRQSTSLVGKCKDDGRNPGPTEKRSGRAVGGPHSSLWGVCRRYPPRRSAEFIRLSITPFAARDLKTFA